VPFADIESRHESVEQVGHGPRSPFTATEGSPCGLTVPL
jgi:hypothetical protein